jgi:hypothetical protein
MSGLSRDGIAEVAVWVCGLEVAERLEVEADLQGCVVAPGSDMNVRTLRGAIVPDTGDVLACLDLVAGLHSDVIDMGVKDEGAVAPAKGDGTRASAGIMARLIRQWIGVDAHYYPIEWGQDACSPAIPIFVPVAVVGVEAIPAIEKAQHPAIAPQGIAERCQLTLRVFN